MAIAAKTAIVTGAGSGVGRAVALALLAEGYQVALAGRRSQALEDTATKSGQTKNAMVVPTDVTDPAAVVGLFERTVAEFGRVDLLFNNAGVNAPAIPVEELTVDQWRKVIDVNVTGMFLCSQQAFKHMKAQRPMGGRIINNGSVSAQSPRPLSAPYTTSKHAVTGLTKSLALDGRALQIAVGQIDIGNAATELNQRMEKGVLQPSGIVAPEPRMNVDNVAAAVLFMSRLPLDTNVLFMNVMATQMPFVGRG